MTNGAQLTTSAHRRTFFPEDNPAIVLLIVRRSIKKCAITQSFARIGVSTPA
jgi:hypothetical protein